jgi:hypothetical protein
MATEHLGILNQGVAAWNLWREKNPTVVPNVFPVDLEGADLREIQLGFAHLNSASLSRANLAGANLCGAGLMFADLRGANLTGANLEMAYLGNAKLDDADLSYARMTATVLDGASLAHAKLTNCSIAHVTFGATDLSETLGLETVNHRAPSSIGIDTIYKSKGGIPESFLRGCGVPESLMRYIPSLLNSEEGIQFYSCFISYSSKDDEFATRLHRRMRDANLRVWFAPEEMKGGNLLIDQIETAIRVYDKLLVVLSEASLRSEWVITELRKARKAERQTGKRKLFPVRLVDFETLRNWECFDADSGKDLALELREYFIPDFSNWKDHDQFEAAFSRLLKDLRAADRAV